MKTLLFLSLALFSSIAMAGNFSTHCQEIEELYSHEQQANTTPAALQDIEQAYDLFCRQSHMNGSVLYYRHRGLATKGFNLDNTTLYYPNGSVLIEQDADGNTVMYYPTGEMISSEAGDVIADLIYGSERKASKIEPLYKAQHAKCAPGCTYVSWGIWGDADHKKRPSCHNSGEAIDIPAIKCGKTTSKALTKKFDAYVTCMRKKFQVLYKVKDHYGHAHIQIPNCKKIKLK